MGTKPVFPGCAKSQPFLMKSRIIAPCALERTTASFSGRMMAMEMKSARYPR